MAEVLIWWLVVQILGLATLPLAWRFFASLPDRGYAFAKPLGIFLTSYLLWILAIFGIVKNTRETTIFIVLALAALCWWWVFRRAEGRTQAEGGPPAGKSRRVSASAGKAKNAALRRHGQRPEILAWLKTNWRIVAIEEIIFLAGLLVWSFFKAYNPEIIATEKPMELAFLNGILRSEQFPPLDPWLSGFSISYYYMGYLMMAVLTRLSGIAPSITFNLTLVLNFALSLTGAFSIVYNLVARRKVVIEVASAKAPSPSPVPLTAVAAGLLASFLVAIMGNLEGFLEFFYARGLGSPEFWRAIGIADLDKPYVSAAWHPTTNWWWWKASRVIGTQGPIGDYTINEFPFFSFMLGDNHPHVLALPYGLMAIALALTILLSPRHDLAAMFSAKRWSQLAGVFLLPALLLGGLFFLNAWDFPTSMVIVGLAYALRVYREKDRLDVEAVKEIVIFAVPLAVLAVILYLPFYLSFQSQASGFGLVRVRSQLHHFLIIFGPFLFMVVGLLAVKIQEWRSWPAEKRQPARAALLPLVILGVLVGAGMLAIQFWTTVTTLLLASVGGVLVSLMLLTIIVVGVFTLACHLRGDPSDIFVLIVAGVACGVALLPEWLYINDNFGGNLTRMNTVFKFLYQSWILFALASAYAFHYVTHPRRAGEWFPFSVPRVIYVLVAVTLLSAATLYPLMAFYTKADQFQGTATLDGMAYMKTAMPDDYAAIQWLNRNVKGTPVIVEAVGGEYSEYARVATHTGLPTVLGWAGHEVQWRGNAKGWEAREGDVNRIYATTDVNEAKNLLRKYDVTYVFVGRLERESRSADGKPKYDATALGKFATFMDVTFQQGNAVIYRITQ